MVRPRLATLGFFERMRLMIGWSDNHAAATCIRPLGFEIIGAVLRLAGLQDAATNGLWLGRDYDGRRWSKKKPPKANQSDHTGTVRSIATFLTLLAQGKLAGADSSGEMLDIMNETKRGDLGAVSFLGEGLDAKRRPRDANYSKIGVLGSVCCEGAWIVRPQRSYISVALGGTRKEISDLAVLLDDAVSAVP